MQLSGNRDANPGCSLSLPNLWSFWADSVYTKWHCVYGVGTKCSDLAGNGICSVPNVWMYCNPFRAAVPYHSIATCLLWPKILGSSDHFKINSVDHSQCYSYNRLELPEKFSCKSQKCSKKGQIFPKCKYSSLKQRVVGDGTQAVHTDIVTVEEKICM